MDARVVQVRADGLEQQLSAARAAVSAVTAARQTEQQAAAEIRDLTGPELLRLADAQQQQAIATSK